MDSKKRPHLKRRLATVAALALAAALMTPVTYIVATRLLWPLPKTKRAIVPPQLLPEKKTSVVGGLRVAYWQLGRGPHLVLVHGLGGHMFVWRYLVPQLQERFRVTAIDLPGFGDSDKPPGLPMDLDSQTSRLSDILGALGVPKACLVGSSMGGTLSLWLARARPTDFPAVFALAPASRPRPIRFLVPFFLTVDRLFPRLVNQFVVTRLWRRTLYWDDIVTPEASRELWRPMQHPETGPIFLRATSTVFDQRLPKALADIKSKVFLFWGEEERIVPESEILEAHRWIKNSELIKIPQASHHPMEDQPVEIANQILRHRHLCPPSHANTSTARQGL